MKPWHYVTGAVWTTPQGPDDGGQCIATRASASRISPTEKDAALRLCAAAPDLLETLRALLWSMTIHDGEDGTWGAEEARAARAAIERAEGN